MRGSDRSLRSHKRDIDDLALSNIMPGGTINRSMPSTPKVRSITIEIPSINRNNRIYML